MAPRNGSNSVEQYDDAPNKYAERKGLILRGEELNKDKIQTLSEKPVDHERVQELDLQLHAAEDKYVALMKDKFGSRLTPARLREKYQNKINRGARRDFAREIGRDNTSDVNVTVNVNNAVVGAPTPISPRRRAEAARRGTEKEEVRDQIDDIHRNTSAHLEDLEGDFEDYIKNKRALILIAQKFREAEPPLLATSLTSGPDIEYAITVALYAYPNMAQDYIRALKAGGSKKEEVEGILTELSGNLEPHISTLLEKEELQAETLKDDITKHAGSGLKKVAKELRRHPMAALVGAGMLVGAISLAWSGGNETVKKWMRRGAIGGGIIGGGAILGNMLTRSLTDDGRDLWDILGLRPDDMTGDGSTLDRISAQFPGLNIENDQSARDLERMLNSDCDDIYTVFSDALRSGKTEINPAQLARMGTDMDDVSNAEARSMNGAASYTALADFFKLLAKKNGETGGSERERIEKGLAIFHDKFVGKSDRPNLNSAILMTIDRADARSASGTVGLDGVFDGTDDAEMLSPSETTKQKRIREAFKSKGIDTWTDSQNHTHDTVIEMIPGLRDGETYVLINGFPWEYKYDADKDLHTFHDPRSDQTLNVGKTVHDNVGKFTEVVVQQRVNDFYAETSLAASTADEYSVHFDETNKEWVAKKPIESPEIDYLGLGKRVRHAALVFTPGQEAPAVRIQESSDDEGVTNFADLEELVTKERVKEVVAKDMRFVTGNLPIQIEKFHEKADPTSGVGEVMIKWGEGGHKGTIKYKNQEIVGVVLVEAGQDTPEELTNVWEAIADKEATNLVENNPDAQRIFTSLTSVFAGKRSYPELPTSIAALKDSWAWASGLDLADEDKEWFEAVNFQQAIIHAEVERAIIHSYSESFKDGGSGALFNETERNRILEAEVKDKVLKPRLEKLRSLTREVAGSGTTGGTLDTIQGERTEELREANMQVEYSEWIQQFKGVMDGEVRGVNLDTVGMEGMESSRLIHDAILATIIEYSSPMHTNKDVFNDPNAILWRTNFEQAFPVIISQAIHDQEGNWWIDQRYNTAAFQKALEAEGIEPWRKMDLSSLSGSLDPSVDVPFYQPEYDEAERGSFRSHRSVKKVPAYRETEDAIDYSRRIADHLRASALTLYSDIDDIESSFRDDEFDNFVNWRLKRVVDEYNEYLAANVDPFMGNPAILQGPLNDMIRIYAEDAVRDMKIETRNLSSYQIYLENPEGFFSMINPGHEADPDDWRQAEIDMLRGMIRPGLQEEDWKDASEDVMDWLNSEYQNENLMGLKVNWIRQDIMEIWMDKHDYGSHMGAPGEIEEYRKFFTDVAEDQMSELRYSADDWRGYFRRNSAPEWKQARGRLKAIPNFAEWKLIYNGITPSDATREEAASLDWERHEKLKDVRQMRDTVDHFMDDFDSNINVAKWTRIDGKWPTLFKSHAKHQIETEILPRVSSQAELELALADFEQVLHIQASFYDSMIDMDVEASDGSSSKNIAAPILLGLGAVGGGALGAVVGGTLGGAGGTAIGAPMGAGALLSGGIGTVAGATTVGAAGAVVGGGLGFATGHLLEAAGIPVPAIDIGERVHMKIRGAMDEVFKDHYLQSGNLPIPGSVSADTAFKVNYANQLDLKLKQIIADAVANDASDIDLGPIEFKVDGAVLDGTGTAL